MIDWADTGIQVAIGLAKDHTGKLWHWCVSRFKKGETRDTVREQLLAALSGKEWCDDIDDILDDAEKSCGKNDITLKTVRKMVRQSRAGRYIDKPQAYGGRRLKKSAKKATKKKARKAMKKSASSYGRRTAKRSVKRPSAGKKSAKRSVRRRR